MSFAQGIILTRLLCHVKPDDSFLNLSAPRVCDEVGARWQFGSAALWVSSFFPDPSEFAFAREVSLGASGDEGTGCGCGSAGGTDPLRDLLPADRSAAQSD